VSVADVTRPASDTDIVQSGMQLRITLNCQCGTSLANPGEQDIIDAFFLQCPDLAQVNSVTQENSLLSDIQYLGSLGLVNNWTTFYVYASVVNVTTVGQLRGEILGACQQINTSKSISCLFSVSNSITSISGGIDYLVTAGSGVLGLPGGSIQAVGDGVTAVVGDLGINIPSGNSITAFLIAVALIGIVAIALINKVETE
jgi:hypothetical protein